MAFTRFLPMFLLFFASQVYCLESTKFSKVLVNKSRTSHQAMNDLADAYWFGNAITINKNKSIDLYKKSSLKGNVSASIKLYQLHRTNMINDSDMVTAKDYLDKAFIDNQRNMKYESEIAVLRMVAFSDLPFHTYNNPQENLKHLEALKDKASPYKSEILFSLGKEYLKLHKYNMKAQDSKAISYIFESVKLNNGRAMLFLADAYENGDYGLLQNKTKAQALRSTASKSSLNEFDFIYDGFYSFPLKSGTPMPSKQ